MKDHEFLRVIEEICMNLRLSRPTIVLVISYYNLFGESKTHEFKPEIIIISCIYLACKVCEELRKIRDILNMVLIVTTLYKKKNKELIDLDPEKYENMVTYASLEGFTKDIKDSESHDKFLVSLVPKYTLEKYNSLRDEILKSEQHLLRILNFNLENKFESFYQLLFFTLKNLKSPIIINNTATGVFNDSFFLKDLQKLKNDWRVLFSIYYAHKLEADDSFKPSYYEQTIEKKFDSDKEFNEEYKNFMTIMTEYYASLEKLP